VEALIEGFQHVENREAATGILVFDLHGQVIETNPAGESIAKKLFPEEEIVEGFSALCRWVRGSIKGNKKVPDRLGSLATPMLSTIRNNYFIRTFLLTNKGDATKSRILILIDSLSVSDHLNLENVGRRFHLSRRELDVVGLLLNGYTNKEIANALSISDETVKCYLTAIRRKMEVSNRTQIISRIASLSIGRNPLASPIRQTNTG